MKFRTKIKISFIIPTLIPIVIMSVLLIYITNSQLRFYEERYGVRGFGMESLTNPTRVYDNMTEDIFENLIQEMNAQPDNLLSEERLLELNKELDERFSFLVLKKNKSIYFNGCEESDVIAEKLPDYIAPNGGGMDDSVASYIYKDYKYLVKQINFTFSDGNSGSVYVVTNIEEIVPRVKALCLQLIFLIILVVLAVMVPLVIWVSRSVTKPLRKLTEATRRIATGDLDFTLEHKNDDEFGELCDDFEMMRKKLKETAEERIREEQENKELISNISHDLKTPITAIKGYVEGIMDGVADTPEKMERYIKTIYNKTNDMDRLIGELTMYSKIDNNRVPYNFTKVNVEDYFNDCIEEISVELASKNIALHYFNYVNKDTIIIADAEQMKRVINNIISNSVKYIGKKPGALNIRINDEDAFIHLEIEDNGKGISQKELPYIFDRFYRADASRNSNQGGSGIGLSIVKKIIEMHGGKIWATSKVDTGTTMHIILRKYYESEVICDEKDTNH